jgi:predicted metal-dependent hydrolase
MQVAVQCKSPLLQKSLELFLEKHLSSINKCDIVIRDEECLNDERCFFIGSSENADLKKPFSKSQLILALEKRYAPVVSQEKESSSLETQTMDFEILEKRIEALTQEYQANILRTVKAFYEK